MNQTYFKIKKEGTKFTGVIKLDSVEEHRFSITNAHFDFVQLEKWVKKLDSGNYEQGQGRLHNLNNNTYCCLGVYREMCETKYTEVSQYLLAECVATMFLGSPLPADGMEFQRIFAALNDSFGFSFAKIAKVIRIFITFLQMPVEILQLDMTDIFFE